MATTPTTPAQAQKDFPTAQSFADFLNQHWKNKRINVKTLGGIQLTGANIGEQWLNWHTAVSAKHPKYSLGDFEMTFFDFAAAEALLGALVQAEVATGQTTAQAAQATVSGLDQVAKNLQALTNPLSALQSIGAFFGGLTQANLWIRVAKVIGGGLILTVGLVKLTGLDSKAPGIVKSAVKAAPLL